ncbi:MAG: nucleotidyltransferase family protein [Bacteroides ovatus]|jgi:D-glycero-alpha-D-manno-heptose 1-phosphate guanylyltransferase
MEVIILAGGLGTRLRSVVSEVPKCMAPVAGRPFLCYLLKYLTRYNVTRVILSVGYLREVIYKWIDEVKDDFPFDFDYAVEEEPLGTGGGIKLALSKTSGNDVLVLNGDTYFDVNLNNFYEQHRACLSSVSLALKPMKKFDRYGAVETNEYHIIKAFHEKQYCKEGLINGGVYLINKLNIDYNALPMKFSFEKEVLERGVQKHNIYGFDFGGYFIDIGIPEDYAKANEEFPPLFKI